MELMKNAQRLKSAADQAVRQRNYQRARQRAFTRLANTYPEVYRSYLEEEKIADEQMGKKWLDIDGNTSLVDSGTR
jgi:alpha-amylase/alpha-mannosidase (GH57 family)